ncbi:P-protein [Escovopsis weberi]|uniref:prephenate dehydratase n=1 Tax=Escovopsis weberi TaxID=150374 RepID=A0A0M9VU79_ESCWE|nr:P-protein [Escovopsis weberi]
MASSDQKPVAVRQVFPESAWELRPASTIDDVFNQVQAAEVAAGVVPFENSTNGSVVFTLDNLADRARRYRDITVLGEIFVDVHHCLVGRRHPHGAFASSSSSFSPGPDADNSSGTRTPTASDPTPRRPRSEPLAGLKHITRLYSHPQAFGQCNAFISTYLKGVEIIDASSTSRAAEIVSQDPTGTWAAIASELAADLVDGLDMLARNIEDRDDNTTRFLIIGARPRGGGAEPSATPTPADSRWELIKRPGQPASYKSMISVTVPHSAPGALAEVLSCFNDFDLNLTSINSRPSLLRPFQYVFLIEFEGHTDHDPDGKVRGALDKIDRVALSWRLLGSWERYR